MGIQSSKFFIFKRHNKSRASKNVVCRDEKQIIKMPGLSSILRKVPYATVKGSIYKFECINYLRPSYFGIRLI